MDKATSGLKKVHTRFWSKVQIKESNDCWPWTASTGWRKYGKFKLWGTYIVAHRIAYWLDTGIYPNDVVIRHTCDNPICCNPAHLIAGSQSDNVKDKLVRNRHSTTASCHPRFYSGEIWLIRRLKKVQYTRFNYTRYKFSSGLIAKIFKTSPYTIFRIWNSESYFCKEGYYV